MNDYLAAAYLVFLALVLVYVAIMAVRLAQAYTHPRVLGTTGGSLPGSKRFTFLVALAGMTLLFITLWKYEMTSKHASQQLRALRRKLAGDDDAVLPAGRSASPSVTITARPTS